MTTTGILTATPPVSPYANLTATTRAGTNGFGAAIWHLSCACGTSLTADSPAIRRGAARCRDCNPSMGKAQENRILAILPATPAKIVRKTKLTYGQVKHRIACMREAGKCHVGDWDRAEIQGAFAPIFYAGKGEDVPCTLKPRPAEKSRKLYANRVKRAIEQVERGGKEDPRYARRIGLHLADKTARQTRAAPNPWFGALPGARASMNAEG